jgi:hypothetical protein
MGTRSRIGVMHGDKVKSVYCHWDGYLAHNGKLLQENYDSAKANHLVSLGDMSSLRAEIGIKHPFSGYDVTPNITSQKYDELYGDMCTFYGRDREETDVDFKVALTFQEFVDQCNNCDAEYYYIMRDGVWYCGVNRSDDSMVQGQMYVLADELAKLPVEA